ncbi:MAG: anaerobic nitric oxide reductase flavorubredoxin [Firmicutes bacterium]|jgi:anaerobic nitric oxide reductase flavorubredoxin|nr:anaerobic nitric oxide reductase flavorubredoxin [Bacillota bacterium]NLO66263.1 anaerobic nitric oxide reductase flavorubredoxin [Bacillota bacterium]
MDTAKKITEKVTWVGKVDWELDLFHGHEFSTHRGSSYNSYLVRDEKTVLIDTVWSPYDDEFVTNLKKVIDLKEIDYIIVNHGEIDHSGALPALMREIPGTPIYCTNNGKRSLQGHFHHDWNIVTVKTGDTLDIGESQLIFVEAPMLHWPDTMFTYMTGENILFSNDAFGQHYATESLYNDLVDPCELQAEALKYYANILTPFSPLVKKKINELLAMELPINLIATSHGVIWKEDPLQIVQQYLKWADNYQENQITIVYDTMWNATRRMAEAIAVGITQEDPNVRVKVYNAAVHDTNDIVTEIFKSKAVLAGSSTVNNRYLSAMAGLLEMVKGMKFKNKKAAAFGSYGWSGEAVKLLTADLEEAGFEVVNEGKRTLWVPSEDELEACQEFGRQFVRDIS